MTTNKNSIQKAIETQKRLLKSAESSREQWQQTAYRHPIDSKEYSEAFKNWARLNDQVIDLETDINQLEKQLENL